MFIGYHVSHEQLAPSVALEAVQRAEAAGFDGAMCSDHFAPWGVRQDESGFAWSWLGAALATTRFSLGVVNAPGQRYHPAIIAQAIATLGEMFPGRFWAALGSGEAMNEHITGDEWPSKPERNARLREAVDVIRRLLAGEQVTHTGRVTVHEARVWSRPEESPLLLGAAVSAETAGWLPEWADGLATVAQEPEALAAVLKAYADGGGRGERVLQVHVSWAGSDAEAVALARDQWRNGLVGPPCAWDLEQPEEFDRRTEDVDIDELRRAVVISADPDDLAAQVAAMTGLGFDRVYLHHVGRDQSGFLAAAERELLPRLRKAL